MVLFWFIPMIIMTDWNEPTKAIHQVLILKSFTIMLGMSFGRLPVMPMEPCFRINDWTTMCWAMWNMNGCVLNRIVLAGRKILSPIITMISQGIYDMKFVRGWKIPTPMKLQTPMISSRNIGIMIRADSLLSSTRWLIATAGIIPRGDCSIRASTPMILKTPMPSLRKTVLMRMVA